MADLDQKILKQLAPHARVLARSVTALPRDWTITPAQRRKADRKRQQDVLDSLWSEAHSQGLTKFVVPPILVSLLCRALWSVIWYLAEQILAEARRKDAA